MMRAPLIALAIAASALSAPAKAATLASIDKVARVSCRAFVGAYKTDIFYNAIAPDIVEWVGRRDGFSRTLNSQCNIMELVRVECTKAPGTSVGDAVNRLFDKDKKGIAFPVTRRCGA